MAAVDNEKKQMEQGVEKAANDSKLIISFTRQQVISMAMHTWSITRRAMQMMGINLSAGFSAMINVAMQTAQLYSSLAMAASANPTTWGQAVLLYMQAGMAGMALASTVISQKEALAEFGRNRNLLDEVQNQSEGYF